MIRKPFDIRYFGIYTIVEETNMMYYEEQFLESFLREICVKEGKYSNDKPKTVISASYEIMRSISMMFSNCLDELRHQYAIYNEDKYLYGYSQATMPALRRISLLKRYLDDLSKKKAFIKHEIDEIKSNGWEYDIGYCCHVSRLLSILGNTHFDI